MIRIDLKVNEGWRFNFHKEISVPFLHLKKIWVMDKDCYGQRAIDLAHSNYAWGSGMVRVELDRWEKGIMTSKEAQEEFDTKWSRYAQSHESRYKGEKIEDSEWYQYEGERFKKNELAKIRKLTKEVEKFSNAFTTCLVNEAGMTEEEACKLVAIIREKLVGCNHFGFKNLIGNFWFKVGEDAIIFIENELTVAAHAWNEKTTAEAKALLLA